MKKTLLILTVLFAANVLLAQNDNGHTVVYNYVSKKITYPSKKATVNNENFVFQIKNINTFKYDISVNGEPVNYNTDIPEIFQLQSLINTNQDSTDDAISDKNDINDTTVLNFTFDDLQKKYKELTTSGNFYQILLKLVSSDISPSKMIELKENYYNDFITEKSGTSQAANIVLYYNKRIENIKLFAPILKADTGISNAKKIIIDTILTRTNRVAESKQHIELAVFYENINEDKFTVNQFIPNPKADEIKINITAKPKTGTSKNDTEIKTEIPLELKGSWKMDFSLGFFATNLTDEDYGNKPVYENNSIAGYKLVRLNNNLNVGIAGFMHLYWRNGRGINGSLTLGLGIDNNTDFRIMPGLSLIVGKKERFIFSGGAVFGKNKYLSPIFDKEIIYTDKIDPVYVEQNKIGLYFGISYNLFKTKASE